MIENLNTDWQTILHDEINSTYFKELTSFVTNQYQNKTCYPASK